MANIYLLVTVTTLFWGANFVLGQFVLLEMTPLWAAAMRFVLGAALMLAIAGYMREQLLVPLRRNAPVYLMLGAVGIVAFNLLFFQALLYTSAINAALIMATNPLLTTLLAAVLIGERPGMRHFIALPIALIGVAVVVTHGHLENLSGLHFSSGDELMFGANLFWALYNVSCKRFMPQGSQLVNTTWIMIAGAALLLAIALYGGGGLAMPSAKGAISMAIMAVGGTVLAYLFWSMGIARLGAARTSIFLNLVPVFAMLLGTIVAVPPTAAQIVGGLLVLTGVSISMMPQRKLASV